MTGPGDRGEDTLAGALRAKSRKRRASLSRSAQANRLPSRTRNDRLPHLELVQRSVDELRVATRNVRTPEPAHVQEVANSIAVFGFCVPLLIDQDGGVIDGVVSLLAARLSGLTRVPCILAGHLSEPERRTLRIALNRLQEKGRWEPDALRVELQELIIEDAPIEITGFSDIELDQILSDDEPNPVETGPLAPEPDAVPVARQGEIYQIGPHRIACGDARDPELLQALMVGHEVRLVLTDVPYNVPIRGHVTGGSHREFAMASGEMTPEEFLAFNQAWMAAAGRYLVDGGVLGTFIDWRGFPTVHAAAVEGALEPLNLVVWSKPNAGMGSLYRSAHELLPLFRKGKTPNVNNVALGQHGRWRSNVWEYPGASSLGSDARAGLKLHPTVKPTAMLEDALLDLTHRGEVVLDPFLGSGSTLIAAERAGRVCYGVEFDPLYVDVALKRYQATFLLESKDVN